MSLPDVLPSEAHVQPPIILTADEELQLEEWYSSHYPRVNIRRGICYCIDDQIAEIVSWREGSPQYQPEPELPIPFEPLGPHAHVEENWDLVDASEPEPAMDWCSILLFFVFGWGDI